MLVALDAIGIREGGGAAVLAELLHWLPRVRPDWHWHVFLFDRHLRQFDDPPVGPNVVLESTRHGHSGAGRLLWVNWLLPRRLRRLRANLLFSFANLGSSRPPVAQVVYCQQRLILFREAHSEYPFLERVRLRIQSFFARHGARASSAVIVQTDGMRDRFLQMEPSLNGKMHVIPCGCRTPSSTASIRPEKRRLMDECARPRVIYVSVLRHHKNHLHLLRGFAEVVKTVPSARLLLTVDEHATPYPEVAGLHAQTRQLVRALGLSDHIVWLGQLTPDEVAYVLAQSDLMVFPSLAESFGLPLVESMVAGCPIAAADLPYARQVAGAAAAYFDPHDPHTLANCLTRLLRGPDQLTQLRREGERLRTCYSYEGIAEQMARVFADAVRDVSS